MRDHSSAFEVPLRHSLRLRLPLLLLGLAVLVLSSFLWATYREVERTLVASGSDRARGAAEEIATTLTRSVERVTAQTEELLQDPGVRAYLRNPDAANRIDVEKLLAPTAGASLRRIELWRSRDSLALVLASPAPDTAPGLKAYPTGLALGDTGVSKLRQAGNFTFFEIVSAVPDTSPSLPPLGYLRRFGRITTSQNAMVKRLLGDQAVVKVGAAGDPVWTDFFVLASAPRRDTAAAEGRFIGENGEAWVGGTAAIEGTPWVVWVGFPRAVVLTPLQAFWERMLVVAIIFLLISAVLAFLLGTYLARPLQKLTAAAKRISQGDFSHRAVINRSDEIGHLGAAFNTMSGHIEEALDALRRTNAQTLFTLAAARIGVWEAQIATGEVKCSDSMSLVHGVTSDQLPSTREAFLQLVHADDRANVKRLLEGEAGPGQRLETEYRALRPDGSYNWVEAKARLSHDHEPIASVLGVSIDVTERRRLESQLRQAQKMEAIGQLAGGVAHDFNNLLTAIVGHGNLILSELPERNRMREEVVEILKAGESAAGLTRQLLSFSRQRVTQPEVINPNAVIDHTQVLLRRLIGEKINLVRELADDLRPVRMDPGNLQQVVVNLAVNARDAMPNGGTLRISTANVELSEGFAVQHAGVDPGPYVMISVVDTGTGMDAQTQARLFEPFFTTKPAGKGTGLGLATVFGIVKQGNGHIYVYSEPGHGTRFTIYLPVTTASGVRAPASAKMPDVTGGTETILVVEDDDAVRAIASTILKRLGYNVHVAANAEQALRLVDEQHLLPDLVLSDVIMPGINGPEMVAMLSQRFPRIKALFTSGYSGGALTALGLEESGAGFIEKPYSPASLAAKVRECLTPSGAMGT